MTMRVRCNDRSECPAEANADVEVLDDEVVTAFTLSLVDARVVGRPVGLTPKDWTDNRGLGGVWRHYCPLHPQPEIAGG